MFKQVKDGKLLRIEIITSSKESANQITNVNSIQQKEYFKGLSANLVNLVAITGTPAPLYQQFCLLYKYNKGGVGT